MRVITSQQATFVDTLINIPDSKLNTVNKIIHWSVIETAITTLNIKIDYHPIALFKTLLIGTWHNLSYEKLAGVTGLKRESLYKIFQAKGSPKFDTIEKVLSAFGYKLDIVKIPEQDITTSQELANT